jgi:hypothetical protein
MWLSILTDIILKMINPASGVPKSQNKFDPDLTFQESENFNELIYRNNRYSKYSNCRQIYEWYFMGLGW